MYKYIKREFTLNKLTLLIGIAVIGLLFMDEVSSVLIAFAFFYPITGSLMMDKQADSLKLLLSLPSSRSEMVIGKFLSTIVYYFSNLVLIYGLTNILNRLNIVQTSVDDLNNLAPIGIFMALLMICYMLPVFFSNMSLFVFKLIIMIVFMGMSILITILDLPIVSIIGRLVHFFNENVYLLYTFAGCLLLICIVISYHVSMKIITRREL